MKTDSGNFGDVGGIWAMAGSAEHDSRATHNIRCQILSRSNTLQEGGRSTDTVLGLELVYQ